MNTDGIEKKVVLRAGRSRVWRALADCGEFGAWFGARFEDPFAAGAKVKGVIAPTTVDAEVAAAQKPWEGTPFEIVVEQMEAERVFSFRWHPGGAEPGVDYSGEPMTLVTFRLEETVEGVALSLTESGFDQLPPGRRAKAFAENEGGWTMMAGVLEKYTRDGQ